MARPITANCQFKTRMPTHCCVPECLKKWLPKYQWNFKSCHSSETALLKVNVIEKHLPCVHCFADDSHLYLSFKPDGQFIQDAAMKAMERCIADIRSWMINDRLLLNDDKTEVLLTGTQCQLNKLDHSNCLLVGDNNIRCVACTRNLGVWFNERKSTSTNINKTRSRAFFHIHTSGE